MRFKNAELAQLTVLSYQRDWRVFSAWCTSAGRDSLPASSDTVELYVADMLGRGRKVSTLERHVVGIQHIHRRAGHQSPCDRGVHEVLSGARRILCQRSDQKEAIRLEDLRAMVKRIGHKTPIAARNSAILLLGWATALRRSNLAALRLEDLTFSRDGVVVRVDHEKQDRKGIGRDVAVPYGRRKITCPVRALDRWLDARGRDRPGPLFCRVHGGHPSGHALLGNRIAQIVQESVATIGLDRKRYGAHSLRAGFATEGLERQVNEISLARQTGHASLDTLRVYLRSRDPFRGNPCSAMGL